jgi:hypothetical protein
MADASPEASQRVPKTCLVVCAIAAIAVFALPLAVPVSFPPTVSASFVAGFNNRVAILAAALIGSCVLLWSFRRFPWEASYKIPAADCVPIGYQLFSAMAALTCLFFAVAGWLIAHSHLRYIADAGYFIEQMSSHAEYGRPLYSHLEFAYGPLLFYPTIWLHAILRCQWLTAYFVTLAFEQVLGLGLLAGFLNALPIRTPERRAGFVLLAVGALNPLLGLNYTFLRFITPFAALWFASGRRSIWSVTASLFAAELLLLGISPELGSAFLVASALFAVLKSAVEGLQWLLLIAAPLAGAGALVLLSGTAYLRVFRSFSRGSMNLPVAPYPEVLIFLFAVVWLVPTAFGARARADRPNAPRIVACYFLGIALLPAAFGRCDPLHVFFNGAGIMVLSLVAIAHYRRSVRLAWLGAFLVFVCWVQWVNQTLYMDRTADTIRLAVITKLSPRMQQAVLSLGPRDSEWVDHLRPSSDDEDLLYRLDVPAMERWTGSSLVATPLEVSPLVEDDLKKSHHYKSDYYSFLVDVMTPAAEARKISDFNQAQWALLPTYIDPFFVESPENLDGVQGFALLYPHRHPVAYVTGLAFMKNLAERWQSVCDLGPYTLYRQRNVEPAPAAVSKDAHGVPQVDRLTKDPR